MTEYRNVALQGAYRRGQRAAEAGVPREQCPYKDHRTDRGSVTFSRAFRRAWVEGWKSVVR